VQTDPLALTFKPAPSAGWAWLAGLVVLLALPLGWLFTPGVFEGEEAIGAWISIGVTLPLLVFFIATLASLPSMRYELGQRELVLRCGPLLTYRIPYEDITDVRRVTLTPSLWSSMRFPGLALWGVPYAEGGTVYMCATRMSRDLLLVTTAKRRYGLTPADEPQFVLALTPRLPKTAASSADAPSPVDA